MHSTERINKRPRIVISFYTIIYNNFIKIVIIINMSNRSSYSYYEYIKNYDAKFLNKYQSGTHWWAGRG